MVNTELLEKEIDACDWGDLVWFNGPWKEGTPAYTEEERLQLQERKKELQKQLDYIKSINDAQENGFITNE